MQLSPGMRRTVLTGGFGLLGLAFLMPNHYVPWTSFEPQAVAALGLLLITIGTTLGDTRLVLRPGVLGWLALGLAFVPLLQGVAQQIDFLSDSILPALYLVGLGLAITVGRALASSDSNPVPTALFDALTLAALVSAAIAWGQWLGQSVLPFANAIGPGQRPVGNLGQPNHLATLLVLGLLGTLDAFERRRLGALTSALLAAFLGCALVMSQSRTGWLALALVGVWLLAQRRRCGLRITSTTIIAGLLGFVALVASWSAINDALLLGAPSMAERIRAGTRLIHWSSLADAATQAPWLGYGWNQVSHAQVAVALDHPASGEPLMNSHNALLDLVLWCGIPLGLTVFAVVVWWFIARVLDCRDGSSCLLLAAFAVIGVHSLLEYPLDHLYFLLPWGLLIGMLDAGRGSTTTWRLPRPVMHGLTVGLAAMLGWVVSEYIAVDSAARAVRLQLAGVGAGTGPIVRPPEVRLLDAPREFHRFAISAARPGMDTAELTWMKAVVDRYPFPPLLLRYALAAGLNGDAAAADRALRLICSIHPPKRCIEGRESWSAAREQHPILRSIEVPPIRLPPT